MRSSLTYTMRFWAFLLVCLLVYQFSSEASADWCKYEKKIDLTLDVSDSELLAINALAGDLDIVGGSKSDKVVISGKACSSKETWLEDARVETKTGKHAQIDVVMPDTGSHWSFTGSSYLWMDLKIEVPDSLALEVKDSSGDLSLENVSEVQVQDSSGDIAIKNARGPVSVRDSSGDIDVDGVEGDFTVDADSSGDIYAENIRGSVLVRQDSSGDIRIEHVNNNVVVERDSSGDIRVADVGGDFSVLKDGSGGISSRDVKGKVVVPDED